MAAEGEFEGSLDYGIACGSAFGYAGTSRSTSARDDNEVDCCNVCMSSGIAGEMIHQFLSQLLAEAQIADDSIGIDLVIVHAGGDDADQTDGRRQSGGDSAGNRILFVCRDG